MDPFEKFVSLIKYYLIRFLITLLRIVALICILNLIKYYKIFLSYSLVYKMAMLLHIIISSKIIDSFRFPTQVYFGENSYSI
ncbi:hypothetical protein Lalb_Chr08g0234441 [Lupinus albus]|uniref:Uncharacterized protein n=1 Tax=Lupinus albus TaxID=3870 RepID=A0A6A4Q3K5_LUPAL|nr:hypothetical protein Lalb_Chr08g0234441 [Lupinus albus]